MSLVCKAGCNRKLNISYNCIHCKGTYHKGCGGFVKLRDDTQGEFRLCGECKILPSNIQQYNLQPNQESRRKRRRNDSASSSTDESDEEIANPTLSDVMEAIADLKKSNKKSFKDLNSKVDANTDSITKYRKEQVNEQKDIKSLFSEISTIKASIANEFTISGHLGALVPNVNPTALVVDVVNFLGIKITDKHIRNVRLVKKNIVQKPYAIVLASNPEPPRIIVKMYSSSKVLRILDARKNHQKILNLDVTQNSSSDKQIFINPMLNKDTYELLKHCKTWAKQNGYKYVWFTDGKILIK